MPKLFLGQSNGNALVAQWIEHLTTDQKVGGSSPFERASGPARCVPPVGALLYPPIPTLAYRSGPHPPRHTTSVTPALFIHSDRAPLSSLSFPAVSPPIPRSSSRQFAAVHTHSDSDYSAEATDPLCLHLYLDLRCRQQLASLLDHLQTHVDA